MLKNIISILCAISIFMLSCTSFATDTENSYLIDENKPKTDNFNSVFYNLKDVYKVTDICVSQYNSEKSGIDGIYVYMSLDGTNYSEISYLENEKKFYVGIANIEHSFSPCNNAQYVKFVFKKADNKNIDIRNIKIKGVKSEDAKNLSKTAKYSYRTNQPFVTGDDIISDDKENKVLNDGDQNTVLSTTSEFTTLIYELDDVYQIEKINVFCMADGMNYIDGYEVLYSLNGKKFQPYGYFVNENPRDIKKIVNVDSYGLVGQNAKFIKLILHTKNMASISEVEISGYDIKQKSDTISLNIKMKNYLLGYIDWSAYLGSAKAYNLYVEKFNFDNVQGLKPVLVFDELSDEFKNRYCEYQPFEPQTTYYIAITGVDKDNKENKKVSPKKITTQGVIGNSPKDIFALNYYTVELGGADMVHVSYQSQHEDNMIELISELNFNKNRWWRHYDSELSRFAKKGLSYSVQNVNNIDEIKNDNSLGTWTYGQGNETDLHGTDVAKYFKDVQKSYNILKNVDKRNVIAAPVLGGTEPTSLKWLENFYKADGKDGQEVKEYFDLMDFHAYCKIMDEQVEGLPTCAPELIYKKLDDLMRVMKKYGDENKPLVATELGWSTFQGRHYLVPVDYETQRDYLTRLYLIFISEGIKEAYLYNFQNSGTDENNFEHNIGIVDWYGVPKPAYYGLYTLSRIMQNAQYIGKMQEAVNPYYGFYFRDSVTSEYITTLWSADNQTKTSTLYVPNGIDNLKILGVDGEYRNVIVKDNRATVSISGAPVFIYASEMLKLENVNVPFSIENSNINVIRGEEITFNVQRNKIGDGVSGEISAELPKGWSLKNNIAFDDVSEKVPVTLCVPKDAQESEHHAVINVRFSDNTILPIRVVFNVVKSIDISIVPENIGADSWELAVYIKNMVDKPLDADVSIDKLNNVTISSLKPIKIDGLKQNEIKRIGFNLNKVVQTTDATVSIKVETDGFSTKKERSFNFSGALNDGVSPNIDGILGEGEWDNAMVVTQNITPQSITLPDWKGNEDCSFKAYRKWDKDNFYLAVEVSDNIHFQNGTGNDIWQGDGLQFGIDISRKDGNGGNRYHEIGIALNNEGDFVGYRWTAPLIIKQGDLVNYRGKINRNENKTIYEISIPWSDLIDGSAPKKGDILGFSLLVNDNDGSGRRGWVEYMGGIGSGKDTSKFEDMVLL